MPEFARWDLDGVRQRETREVGITRGVIKAEQKSGMRASDMFLNGFQEARQPLVAPLPVNPIHWDVEVQFVEVRFAHLGAWHWLLDAKGLSAALLPPFLTIVAMAVVTRWHRVGIEVELQTVEAGIRRRQNDSLLQ